MIELEALEGFDITLFGQPQNFSILELTELLTLDQITLQTLLTDNTRLLVQGRLISPDLEARLDQIETEGSCEVVSIEAFEQAVADSIHQEGLFLSLKLSHDRARLLSYLKNTLLSDAVFIKLLSLYTWEDASFFETDSNRDVSAAITRRFYPHLERNHNIEYSPMGILQTVAETQNSELLNALYQLEPVQKGFDAPENDIAHQILKGLILNDYLDPKVLEAMAQKASDRLNLFMAHAQSMSDAVAHKLLASEDREVVLALSANDQLSKQLKKDLIEKKAEQFPELLALITLDSALFEQIVNRGENLEYLAQNLSLTEAMIETLFTMDNDLKYHLASNQAASEALLSKLCEADDTQLQIALASNEKLSLSCMQKLFGLKNANINEALASNRSCDPKILEYLASEEEKVALAVASNPQTPVDTLYQLHLDMRYAHAVKANPAFGEKIREGIGW